MIDVEPRVEELLGRMTLREKIGQMSQSSGPGEKNKERVREAQVGSLLNVSDPGEVNEYQKISVQETRLGIPLIIGRDVIHGFRTIFPIPLGQAASWNLELVEKAARVSAREASACGVRWAFSPMVDIARDARWGRIAEGAGEDPLLAGRMGAAMIKGYQGDDLSDPESLAACAKHFVAYGAAEGGRDYNTAEVSERTLRDVYLRPFKACVDAGVATMMSGFHEIAGVPASGNAFTLRKILRDEWHFDGFVVSDYASVEEMIVHGFCADRRDAARESALAGVDMEMVSPCYRDHLESLIASGEVPMAYIDAAVRSILRLKFRLGLFENAQVDLSRKQATIPAENLEAARQMARESCVLLKNDNQLLPLKKDLSSIALIGPFVDNPGNQQGCWVMDGNLEDVVTPAMAFKQALPPATQINIVPGLSDLTSTEGGDFAAAVEAARTSEAVVMFLGESANFSGEARCRAFLDLPESQMALVKAVHQTGKPLVAVLMTGRPLTVPWIIENVPALLLAWHPGTMGGPAIADLIFGDHSPTGKLPVSIPRTVGQVPLYYNHMNTGRPALDAVRTTPVGTPENPVGYFSRYLDVDHTPEYPFGFGLSYTTVHYGPAQVVWKDEQLTITAQVTNTGTRATREIAQLYVRDLVGSVTRPVKELKGFQRIALAPGETKHVAFTLTREDLSFYDRHCQLVTEAGDFHIWISGSSDCGEPSHFTLPAIQG